MDDAAWIVHESKTIASLPRSWQSHGCLAAQSSAVVFRRHKLAT